MEGPASLSTDDSDDLLDAEGEYEDPGNAELYPDAAGNNAIPPSPTAGSNSSFNAETPRYGGDSQLMPSPYSSFSPLDPVPSLPSGSTGLPPTLWSAGDQGFSNLSFEMGTYPTSASLSLEASPSTFNFGYQAWNSNQVFNNSLWSGGFPQSGAYSFEMQPASNIAGLDDPFLSSAQITRPPAPPTAVVSTPPRGQTLRLPAAPERQHTTQPGDGGASPQPVGRLDVTSVMANHRKRNPMKSSAIHPTVEHLRKFGRASRAAMTSALVGSPAAAPLPTSPSAHPLSLPQTTGSPSAPTAGNKGSDTGRAKLSDFPKALQEFLKCMVKDWHIQLLTIKPWPEVDDIPGMMVRARLYAEGIEGCTGVSLGLSLRACDWVRNNQSRLRGDVKEGALALVSKAYGVSRATPERVKALLHGRMYIYTSFSTFGKVTGSFHHPAILDVIQAGMFGSRVSIGFQHMDHFSPMMPLPTIAFACIIIENALHELLNESPKMVQLDQQYAKLWFEVLAGLQEYELTKPGRCEKLQREMTKACKKASQYQDPKEPTTMELIMETVNVNFQFSDDVEDDTALNDAW